MTDADRLGMERALDLAREAAECHEVPVGAVVVAPDGTQYGARNRTRELADPTAHAEILAIRHAAAHQGDWRLEGHVLYVTLEPCTMCAGAIVLSRVERVVFGAHDPKAGMCGSLGNLVQDARLNHRVTLVSGVLADQASSLLKTFFADRR